MIGSHIIGGYVVGSNVIGGHATGSHVLLRISRTLTLSTAVSQVPAHLPCFYSTSFNQ